MHQRLESRPGIGCEDGLAALDDAVHGAFGDDHPAVMLQVLQFPAYLAACAERMALDHDPETFRTFRHKGPQKLQAGKPVQLRHDVRPHLHGQEHVSAPVMETFLRLRVFRNVLFHVVAVKLGKIVFQILPGDPSHRVLYLLRVAGDRRKARKALPVHRAAAVQHRFLHVEPLPVGFVRMGMVRNAVFAHDMRAVAPVVLVERENDDVLHPVQHIIQVPVKAAHRRIGGLFFALVEKHRRDVELHASLARIPGLHVWHEAVADGQPEEILTPFVPVGQADDPADAAQFLLDAVQGLPGFGTRFFRDPGQRGLQFGKAAHPDQRVKERLEGLRIVPVVLDEVIKPAFQFGHAHVQPGREQRGDPLDHGEAQDTRAALLGEDVVEGLFRRLPHAVFQLEDEFLIQQERRGIPASYAEQRVRFVDLAVALGYLGKAQQDRRVFRMEALQQKVKITLQDRVLYLGDQLAEFLDVEPVAGGKGIIEAFDDECHVGKF